MRFQVLGTIGLVGFAVAAPFNVSGSYNTTNDFDLEKRGSRQGCVQSHYLQGCSTKGDVPEDFRVTTKPDPKEPVYDWPT